MASFVERVVGAARLDARVYEEVEADTTAMGQAMAVVAAAALAAGVGSIANGAMGALAAVVGGLVGWFLWAVVTWLVGTKLLPEPGTSADLGELLPDDRLLRRPGLLNVLGSSRSSAGSSGSWPRSGSSSRWSSRYARRSTTRARGARCSSA